MALDKLLTCETCGYQTARKDHFQRHLKSHTGERPVKCELCTFSCRDKYHLMRHMKSSVHAGRDVSKCL